MGGESEKEMKKNRGGNNCSNKFKDLKTEEQIN